MSLARVSNTLSTDACRRMPPSRYPTLALTSVVAVARTLMEAEPPLPSALPTGELATDAYLKVDLADRTLTPHVPRMPMSLTPPAPGPMTADRGALTLVSPISGVLVPLDAVPDPAFAQRLAGDGVSIDPLSDLVVAPCDGLVRLVHRAGHAVTIEALGLEIVIHVGLDTVALRGEGFHPLVKSGDSVRAGDPLLRFDVDLVARRARSLLTEMVIANMDVVSALRPRSGRVVGGRDVVLAVTLHEQRPGSVW